MDLWSIVIVFGQVVGWAGPLDFSIEECQHRADMLNGAIERRKSENIDPDHTKWVCIFMTDHPETLMTTPI